MDKFLILKILGKKDFVELDDQIYNLREIIDDLRQGILLKVSLNTDFIDKAIDDLTIISNSLNSIKDILEDSFKIPGYTNSKKYLHKFTFDLCLNIEALIENMNPIKAEAFIYHTNIIADLVYSY